MFPSNELSDLTIAFVKLHEAAFIPEYATPGSSGFDLKACLIGEDCSEEILILPGQRELIPLHLTWVPPPSVTVGETNYALELQLRARSGLAYKHGIGLVNGVGTIDNDYRGPIGVLLQNWGSEPFRVTHGDRIAQGVVSMIVQPRIKTLSSVPSETQRGSGGFGHTGLR